MKRSAIFAGLTVLFTSLTVFASAASISVWDADISGTIKSGADAGELNLQNDLKLGDDNIAEFRADLNMLGSKAYLHYYQAENTGTNPNPGLIRYHGTTFDNGPVKSELKQTVIDLNTEKTLVKSDALQLDLIGGLRYLDLKSKLQDNSNTASDSVKAIVPIIGLGAQTHLSADFLAKASISGLDISFGSKKVDTYDLKYGFEYTPTADIAIGAGVQKSKLTAEDGDSKGDLYREGNYFEVVVKF